MFQTGKFFYSNGNRYEGEWKDDMRNGQGNWMKEIISCSYFMCFDLFKTGKFFYSNGSRYEGEWKDDEKNGQGNWIKEIISCSYFMCFSFV